MLDSATSSPLSSVPSDFDHEAYPSDDHFDDVLIVVHDAVSNHVVSLPSPPPLPTVKSDLVNTGPLEHEKNDKEPSSSGSAPRKNPREEAIDQPSAIVSAPLGTSREEVIGEPSPIGSAPLETTAEEVVQAVQVPPVIAKTSSMASAEMEEDVMTTTRTSRRKRVAPPRFDETIEPESKKKTPATGRKRAPARGNFTPDFLLRDPKSKLTTIDLAELLSLETAWTVLTREEQLHLIAMIPGEALPDLPDDIELPNIPKQVLKSNSSFRADVRLYQEDLEAGRYDPSWLKDAKVASEQRASGKFDDWKEKNREEFWGQKQRTSWTANAGESSQHSLGTLVAAGCFEVGDVWLLNRGLRKDKATLTVEKEATITSIAADHTLTFTFPPGQDKFSPSVNGDDLVVSNIGGPKGLSDAILNEDGRIVNVRGPNSWREFRCFRRNQDIGGLWDIRDLYHSRQ